MTPDRDAPSPVHRPPCRLPRRGALSTLLSFGALTLAAPLSAAPQPARELEVADFRSYLPETHPVRRALHVFAGRAAALSSGRLAVRVRSDALPGRPDEQMAALREGGGQAPALMLVTVTGLAPLEPAFGVLDFPFVLRSAQQADALLDGPFGDALLRRLPQHGLVGLAWWENGFRQISSAKAPLRRAEDFRGVRFRVIPEPFFSDIYRALGAEPVPMLFKPVYEALGTGRVEAQENTEAQMLAARYHEVQSWLTASNHGYSAMALVANARTWQSLTLEQQEVLREAAREAGRAQRRWAREDAKRARAQLVAHGMRVAELADGAWEQLDAATRAVRERHASRFDPRLMDIYERELARIRSASSSVAAMR